MRQVSRDQLITTLRFTIQRVRPGVLARLASSDDRQRASGADIIAAMLVDGPLSRFEILTDAPLPPTEMEGMTVNGRAEAPDETSTA